MNDIDDLRSRLRKFASDRDWDQFHSPKNLVMALSVEVAELMEHFQWLTEEKSRALPDETLAKVRDELADIMLYLLQVADKLGVDLIAAANAKLAKNAER